MDDDAKESRVSFTTTYPANRLFGNEAFSVHSSDCSFASTYLPCPLSDGKNLEVVDVVVVVFVKVVELVLVRLGAAAQRKSRKHAVQSES